MRRSDELAEDLHVALEQLVRTMPTGDSLSPGEAVVLGYLDRDGPQTTADLAQRRGVSHLSAAKSVKELLDQDLVRVEVHPTDGRKLLLHLNAAGRKRLDDQRRRRAHWLGAAVEKELTPADREELERAVELLSRLVGHRPTKA